MSYRDETLYTFEPSEVTDDGLRVYGDTGQFGGLWAERRQLQLYEVVLHDSPQFTLNLLEGEPGAPDFGFMAFTVTPDGGLVVEWGSGTEATGPQETGERVALDTLSNRYVVGIGRDEADALFVAWPASDPAAMVALPVDLDAGFDRTGFNTVMFVWSGSVEVDRLVELSIDGFTPG